MDLVGAAPRFVLFENVEARHVSMKVVSKRPLRIDDNLRFFRHLGLNRTRSWRRAVCRARWRATAVCPVFTARAEEAGIGIDPQMHLDIGLKSQSVNATDVSGFSALACIASVFAGLVRRSGRCL